MAISDAHTFSMPEMFFNQSPYYLEKKNCHLHVANHGRAGLVQAVESYRL